MEQLMRDSALLLHLQCEIYQKIACFYQLSNNAPQQVAYLWLGKASRIGCWMIKVSAIRKNSFFCLKFSNNRQNHALFARATIKWHVSLCSRAYTVIAAKIFLISSVLHTAFLTMCFLQYWSESCASNVPYKTLFAAVVGVQTFFDCATKRDLSFENKCTLRRQVSALCYCGQTRFALQEKSWRATSLDRRLPSRLSSCGWRRQTARAKFRRRQGTNTFRRKHPVLMVWS